MSEEKTLAEQQLEIEDLQLKDPAMYGLADTQSRLEAILTERLRRGEIDEFGRETRHRSAATKQQQ